MIHQLRENSSGWPERRSIVYGPWTPYTADEASLYFLEQKQSAARVAADRKRIIAWRVAGGLLSLGLAVVMALVVARGR